MTWQTRLWIDDMFMITMVQAQAFRATGERAYMDRAAKEMVVYLNELQRPNGLFYHAPDVPFFWGRGNGWMAAGTAELLRSLRFQPGDELLTTSHGYNACTNVLRSVAEPSGAEVMVAPVDFPVADAATIERQVLACVGPRTRLVLLDQITSPTALVFPVERLVRTHVGSVALGDQRPGTLRVLGRDEVGSLYKAVGL